MKMLESGLKERIEWLAVADVHDHQTATRYAEDDELSSIVLLKAGFVPHPEKFFFSCNDGCCMQPNRNYVVQLM